MQYLIKNGQVVTHKKIFKGDILIDGGRIKRIGRNFNEKNTHVFDASGLTILPGLIDIHVHLRDPGATHKEDFHTGTSAALAGGVTTIVDMPNNPVPTTTSKTLDVKIKIAKKKSVCDFGFHFGAARNNFREFKKVERKVAGIKMYLNPTTGPLLLEKLSDIIPTFKYWRGSPILVHAEGRTAAEVLGLASLFKKQVHFCHIGVEELPLITEAKRKNSAITCGITPHHLFLTGKDEKTIGSFAKMRPPLVSKEGQRSLWQNLRFIDLIETDHAPHSREEKNTSFEEAPNGVTGLETMLPLLLDASKANKITPPQIVEKTSFGPAEILNLHSKGQIKPGFDADFTLVDLDKYYTIRNENLKTKCGWTPFAGWKVRGKIVATFLRGHLAYEDGKILVPAGFGRLVQFN
jgi:dihydroorotase-like cyclic amidohydrolase